MSDETPLVGEYAIDGSVNTGPNALILQKKQAIASGTATHFRFYITEGIYAKVCVYSDVSGSPALLLANSSKVLLIAGWNNIPLGGGCDIVSGAEYWLGFIQGTLKPCGRTTSSGVQYKYKSHPIDNDLPSPLTGLSNFTGPRYSLSLWQIVSGGAGRLIGSGDPSMIHVGHPKMIHVANPSLIRARGG